MSEIIRAQSYTFMQLFDRNYFHVPKFQRAFAWRKENVNDFWEDITEAMASNKKHFFGSLVLQASNKDHHFIIFDGQQRLTVVVSLISIIRNELLNLDTDDLQLNTNIQNLIKNTQRYLWDKDNQSFLQLSSQYQRIFKEYICTPHSKLHDNRFKANEFLRNYVFKNLSQKISEELENRTSLEDKFRFLYQLFKFVNDSIYFAVIYADIHFSASTLFETLNYRGATLKVEDLLKSIILARALDQRTLKMVEGLWYENLELIDKNGLSFSEFLRNYWSFVNSKVAEGSLYKILKRDIEIENVDILDYMNKMNHYLKLYIQIAFPKKCNTWKNNEKIQNSLEALSLLGAKLCYPLLLSLFSFTEAESDQEVRKLQQKLVGFLECFFFRIHVCNQKITKEIISLIMTYTKEIRLDPKNKIELLLKELRPLMPNNNIFEQGFSSYVSSNRKMSFYILYKIERFLSGRATPISDNPTQVTIEHIMPQKLGYGWSYATNYHKAYLNRIGNLTLISKSLNVTNTAFLRKRDNYYINSNVRITESLGLYNRWRKKEMNERQKELAQKAIEIW